MLDYERIEELLKTQNQAYELLKWLTDAVFWQPHLLVPQEAALLHKPEAARQWLDKYQASIPVHLLPESFDDAFVNLFSSFFSTSFRIGHFEYDGKLIESNVRVGANQPKAPITSPAHCEFLALTRLCNAENIVLTDKEAKALIKRKTLKEALTVWTYVWELDRRARGKGKGSVAHQLWRSIPKEIRESLDAKQVWDYKEQVLTGVRAHVAELTN